MTVCFTNTRHFSQAFSSFLELREMEELFDIKLETCVDEIAAHRVVLAACSSYFRDALKEWDVDEETFTIPEEHNSKVVAAIINYFYTGRLEVDASLLSEVIDTAMFFQASEIVERCEDIVVQSLNCDNCFQYYFQTQKFNLKDLQGSVTRFINWHFLELTEQEAFLDCSAEDICTFASNDVLNVEKEEDVYEALWKWFKHDEENRKSQQEQVFSTVRFFQLHPDFMKERVIPELFKNKTCTDKIAVALHCQGSDKKKRTELLKKLTPRYPSQAIYMFHKKSGVVEKYDPVKENCVKEKRMMKNKEPFPRAAVVVDNELYVVSSEKVEKFNKNKLLWENVARGTDIWDSAICADKDCFYVIGGKGNSMQTEENEKPGLSGSSVNCFNILSCSWSQLPNMKGTRRLAACVAHDKRIYVMGGMPGVAITDVPMKSTQRFSGRSRTRNWRDLANMNTARFDLSAIVVGNIIYVIGGRDDSKRTLNTIEIFNVDSDKQEWLEIEPKMNRPRTEFGVALYQGEIWCLGGRGESTIEKFNFTSQTWETVGKLADVRYAMSAVMFTTL